MDSHYDNTSDELILRLNGRIYARFNGSMWFVDPNLDCPTAIAFMKVIMNYIFLLFASVDSNIPFNFNGTQNWTGNTTWDFGENETSGNSNQNPPNGLICSEQYHNLYAYLTLKVCASILCLFMLGGNFTIVLLGFFDKSFQSPLLTTIQSFSAFSVARGIFEWSTVVFPCTAGAYAPGISCLIRSSIVGFTDTMLYVHLIILSILRIYVTLYPLHAMVKLTKRRFQCYLLFTSLIVMLYMIVFYYCFSTCIGSIPMPTAPENIFFWFLIGKVALTIIMSVISMIISLVQSRRSASKLQLSSYRQQSRVASVLIIMYLLISVPTQFFTDLVVAECSDSLLMTIVDGIGSVLRLLFLTINPIILCLRLDSVRQRIRSFFLTNLCFCIQKKPI